MRHRDERERTLSVVLRPSRTWGGGVCKHHPSMSLEWTRQNKVDGKEGGGRGRGTELPLVPKFKKVRVFARAKPVQGDLDQLLGRGIDGARDCFVHCTRGIDGVAVKHSVHLLFHLLRRQYGCGGSHLLLHRLLLLLLGSPLRLCKPFFLLHCLQ